MGAGFLSKHRKATPRTQRQEWRQSSRQRIGGAPGLLDMIVGALTPNGMLIHSKKPKEVITAVPGMSPLAIRT